MQDLIWVFNVIMVLLMALSGGLIACKILEAIKPGFIDEIIDWFRYDS